MGFAAAQPILQGWAGDKVSHSEDVQSAPTISNTGAIRNWVPSEVALARQQQRAGFARFTTISGLPDWRSNSSGY
jgi:hypothetical protein